MPLVYITHDAGVLDFSSAEKWGQLQRVTSGPVNPFNPDQLYPKIWPVADTFDLTKDFLILAGNMIPTMIFVARLARRCPPMKTMPIGVLVWDAVSKKYTLRTFMF